MECSLCVLPNQFRRFGDEHSAICGQTEMIVNYVDFTLSFACKGNIKIHCPQCNEKFITAFTVDSRFKILRSEKEVKKDYDFLNTSIEIISAETDSSFLELLEDELILGNYSVEDKHTCRSIAHKSKKHSCKKNKEKIGAYRPFEVLSELMNK